MGTPYSWAAFTRALDINPDLSIAHNLYAQLEVDLGRAEDAMLRLIGRSKARGSDPDLFAGLVHACRFCGLLDASVAATARLGGWIPVSPPAPDKLTSCSVTTRRSLPKISTPLGAQGR